MAKYGLGYLPDTHDKSKDLTIRHLLGAPFRLPPSYSLLPYVTQIYDQGQNSDCVGFAFAQTISERLRVVNTPIELPSPVAIYTYARILDRTNASQPLLDQGCQPFHAVQGLLQYGAPPISMWPVDPSHINDEPDLLKLEQSSAFKYSNFYRIASQGQQRLLDIKHSISSGYPVAVGTLVDQTFEDYGPSSPPLPPPDITNALGGHMLHLVAYNADGTFVGVNQWSSNWGRSGLFIATPNWVTSQAMSDIYIIECHATGA